MEFTYLWLISWSRQWSDLWNRDKGQDWDEDGKRQREYERNIQEPEIFEVVGVKPQKKNQLDRLTSGHVERKSVYDARVHSCCRVVINGCERSCANRLENDLATKTNWKERKEKEEKRHTIIQETFTVYASLGRFSSSFLWPTIVGVVVSLCRSRRPANVVDVVPLLTETEGWGVTTPTLT